MPLGHELFALVDAADAARVLAKRWHAWRKPGRPDVIYAQHTFRHKSVNGVRGKSGAIWLHLFVLELPAGQIADHQDGNGLNCRRSNLRPATRRENSQNVTRSKNQRAGAFKGVVQHGNSWVAAIRGGDPGADGRRKRIYLGSFSTAELAAAAYDAAAIRAFGAFASTNFPHAAPGLAEALGGGR